MAVEEAKYKVVEKDGDFELRSYEPQIVAETIVGDDFDDAGNEGFRRLFAYISGKNRSRGAIAMTAPVNLEASPEKIVMTAPVGQERDGGSWRVSFLMPPGYTMETLPEPLDPRVVLRQVPPRLIAAHRYSGTWGRARFEDRLSQLRSAVEKRGLRVSGEAVFARYNPPFIPWFLRRNEVLLRVER